MKSQSSKGGDDMAAHASDGILITHGSGEDAAKQSLVHDNSAK